MIWMYVRMYAMIRMYVCYSDLMLHCMLQIEWKGEILGWQGDKGRWHVWAEGMWQLHQVYFSIVFLQLYFFNCIWIAFFKMEFLNCISLTVFCKCISLCTSSDKVTRDMGTCEQRASDSNMTRHVPQPPSLLWLWLPKAPQLDCYWDWVIFPQIKVNVLL